MKVLGEGQYIRHGQYGTGVVTQSNSERTTIDFDEFGTKKFVTSIWSAEIIGETLDRSSRSKRRRKSAKPRAKVAAR
jgi:hypothetical protein